MWVAHECRRTCGLTTWPSPARSARPRTTAQAPCRLRRLPRLLRNTASASLRRAHRAGSMYGRPAGPSQRSSAESGRTADGHEPFLRALAEQAHEPVVPAQVTEREADRLRDAGAGGIEQLEQGPVPQVDRLGPAGRGQEGEHLLLGEGLWKSAGQLRGSAPRRWDRPCPLPRRRGSGRALAGRSWLGRRPPGRGRRPAALRGSARPRRCWARSGRCRPRRPIVRRRRGRGGRR